MQEKPDAMASSNESVMTIRPPSGRFRLGLGELIQYHHFIYTLFWRDLRVRYKQSVLGIGWVWAQPFVMMIVFTVIFGNFAKVPSDGIPYPLFSFSGILPWMLFQRCLVQGGASLVAYRNEITKIYFPRIIAPLSVFLSSAFDFAIAMVIMVGLMIFYGVAPTPKLLLLPIFMVYTCFAAMSVVLWLSAINVEYRDIQQMVPFLAQVWMFVTPVVYPLSIVSSELQILFAFNPIVGVVEAFRWMILDTPSPDPMLFLVSSVFTIVLFVSGLGYFNRVSLTIADRI